MAAVLRVANVGRGMRFVLAGVATLVLASAGVVGGLLWPTNDPETRAAEQDAFDRPPDCALLDEETLDAVVPDARVEQDTRGPVTGGQQATCAWSTAVSATNSQEEQEEQEELRALTVEFEVQFTQADTADGAQLAANRLATDLPEAPFPEAAQALGPDARAQPGTGGSGREVAFVRDNLVVWVWYGGTQDSTTAEIPGSDAHEAAHTVAEQLAERL